MLSSFALQCIGNVLAIIVVALMFYRVGWERGHHAGYQLRKTLDHAQMYGMSSKGKTRHSVRANPDGTHSHIYEE